MKPLAGRQKAHCSMGHKLELPIANDFMNDLNMKEMFPGFKIVSLYGVGLVAKKGCPWAKNSVDFIAAVENNATLSIEFWGIEIKSQQTTNTINLEKEKLMMLNREKYTRIKSHQSFEHIRVRSERFQVLHHAYVYGFKTVALVIGNKGGKVICGTFVDYENEFMESYGKVLKKLKDDNLKWAYNNYGDDDAFATLQIPDDILAIADKIPTINGSEALYGTLKLWHQMFHNPSRLPLPILKKIIPTSHAKWNACKGGSDTITKLIDDCICKPPKQHSNNQAACICRCIANLTATILRLYQMTTAKKDLARGYPSLQHYCNAASKQCTYQQMCRKLYRTCKLIIESIESQERSVEFSEEAVDRRRPIRHRRKKYNNTLPVLMDFAPSRTYKTPKKASLRKVAEGQLDPMIIHHSQNCSGFPFEIVDHDEGNKQLVGKDVWHKCVRCGAKTKWYCINCKHFFCMSYQKNKN